jgi:transposase
VTKRLAESVARLCEVLPILDVAEHFHLGWDAVKRIHKEALRDSVPPIQLGDLEVLAIDEFAIQKGHRYATVVINPRSRKVLWVGRGRGREDVRKFFDCIGQEGKRRIRAVVMDMSGAYANEVREQCPHAEIVYDQFHVVAKYAREVVDRVRVDEANRVGTDRKSRKWIKGSRWLLLRNRSNLASAEDRTRLTELLKANRNLLKVYLLKDDLKHLWDYKYPGAARRFWKAWKHRACCSRLEPLRKFAKKLEPYIEGIITHCRWPFHTSVLEGINNKIKVIKRMAYGYRDDEYFFLRIRAAFPGKPG